MSVGASPDPLEPGAVEADPGLDIDLLRRRRERVLTLGVIVLVLAFSAVAAYFFLRTPPPDRQVITDVAQRTIRETLGLSNKFDFGSPVHVEIAGYQQFLVRGELVMVDEKLTVTHYWYDCLVHRQSDGTWGPEKLTLLPQ